MREKILYIESHHGLSARMMAEALESLLGVQRVAEVYARPATQKAKDHMAAVMNLLREVCGPDAVTRMDTEICECIRKVVACLDDLGDLRVLVPVIYEGMDDVEGLSNVPVPSVSVLAILEKYHLPVHLVPGAGELLTVEGAAIVAVCAEAGALPEQFRILKTGTGSEHGQVLRMMLLEDCHEAAIYKLESNIDDCTGEVLGYVMARLFEAGARDVHYIPVQMKKNRPAWQLNVITDQKHIEVLEDIIFRETTTIGIRRIRVERSTLERSYKQVMTPFGEVQVKICSREGLQKCYPEYEDVAKLARAHGVSFMEVFEAAVRAC